MENWFLKTKVKIGMHILVPSDMFSTMANFKGTHTPMHVLKKVEKGKIMKLFNYFPTLIYKKFEHIFRREVLT